jgi:hypothetical protein
MPFYGAITNPTFMPAVRDITAITNGFPLEVTTSFPHSYLSGLIVRLLIPPNFGMVLLNQAEGSIVVTGPTTFTMTIDSTNIDPFVIPPDQPQANFTPAQVVPIGEEAAQLNQSFVNILTPQF